MATTPRPKKITLTVDDMRERLLSELYSELDHPIPPPAVGIVMIMRDAGLKNRDIERYYTGKRISIPENTFQDRALEQLRNASGEQVFGYYGHTFGLQYAR